MDLCVCLSSRGLKEERPSLRIPGEADRDSVLMPTAIPESCRPAFRWEADRNSGASRPVF